MDYNVLRELVMIPSPSGEEEELGNYIIGVSKKLPSIHIKSDKRGNIYISNSQDMKSLDYVFLVHMDQISITVVHIDDRKADFVTIPRTKEESLVNQMVVFENGEIGIIKKNSEKTFVDICGSEGITIGMSAVLKPQYHLQGDYVYGTALDNKVGCMLGINLINRLHLFKKKICIVFTTQEEFDARGSSIVTNFVDSKIIIGIDVTNARDCYENTSVEIGKGVAIKQRDSGILVQKSIVNKLMTIANKRNIKSQIEVIDRGSTDVKWLDLLNGNISFAALSIPCKYGHTSCEIVHRIDLEETFKLLIAICEGDLIL